MDVWITYRLLDDTGGDAGEQQRHLFSFPDTGEGFELKNGQRIGYGPSIGQMLAAVRARHAGDAVIVRTERVDGATASAPQSPTGAAS
ncbi:hypothetical protein [Microtetraspora niveoalba]|uniref:hypothetical protein n=1 Tax=Microtetraspora niveoalba TaxID=46175 RepID=UPI0008308BFA|nr:hypothetical protein [Microtetraspora niveoalba]